MFPLGASGLLGWPEKQILENYPNLTQESLRAVYAFAAVTLGDSTFHPFQRKTG